MQRSFIDYAMSVIVVAGAAATCGTGSSRCTAGCCTAMYDSGFRPDRGTVKSSRVVGDVMGNYHPHGDSSIYDTVVRMAQPWSLRYPMIDGQGNFGSPGNDPPAAMRYTECRLTPLAMLMLAGIDENTVDMIPNYDNKTTEPTVLPARIPNLLVNGSSGIAVGMATNIPPHNLREVVVGRDLVAGATRTPPPRSCSTRCMERVHGPGLPDRRADRRRDGISDAYRTGRGSIRMRAVVDIEEDAKGRTILVVTELPYQVNPDNLVESIATAAQGRPDQPASPTSPTSPPTGSACGSSSRSSGTRSPRWCWRTCSSTPRCRRLRRQHALHRRRGAAHAAAGPDDQLLRARTRSRSIVRRTQYRLDVAEKRAHILRGLVKALDMLDEVIALIRALGDRRGGQGRPDRSCWTSTRCRPHAILDMQLRRLAALERQKIVDELAEIEREIADLKRHPGPARAAAADRQATS